MKKSEIIATKKNDIIKAYCFAFLVETRKDEVIHSEEYFGELGTNFRDAGYKAIDINKTYRKNERIFFHVNIEVKNEFENHCC